MQGIYTHIPETNPVPKKHNVAAILSLLFTVPIQGRPLGGANGALAPGADFERAPKRRSPTGHTLIRSTVT
jgi:hypothetical protein